MEGLVEESEEQISIIINKSDNNKLFIGIYTIPDPKVKDKVQISMSDRFATAAKCSMDAKRQDIKYTLKNPYPL